MVLVGVVLKDAQVVAKVHTCPEGNSSASDTMLTNTTMVSITDGPVSRLPPTSPTSRRSSGGHAIFEL